MNVILPTDDDASMAIAHVLMSLLSAVGAYLALLALVEVLYIWRTRPMVIWDERERRWRAARLVRREQAGR